MPCSATRPKRRRHGDFRNLPPPFRVHAKPRVPE
jgi:hypothetical protein